jgi:UDP-3-O-[3-hydroxymyristoyl] glucosamine N-acyltransferase
MILLKEIITKLNPVEFSGNTETNIERVAELSDKDFKPGDIAWCSDKNVSLLSAIHTGTIILSPTAFATIKSGKPGFEKVNWIVAEVPRRAFMQMLQAFFVRKHVPSISALAHIHASVIISPDCNIGHGVVIEEGCVIGKNVSIGHNSVIGYNTIIEDNVIIGSNNTIGGIGFGYEKTADGNYEMIPHIGNVHICASAEIGNNTAIDRAVIGSTRIGPNAKIDNLVHIAHGVKIGANSLIIAHAMIAGSVEIGENVWVSPAASVLQKIKVGNNALIGMGSVVLKDVPENKIVVGAPAKIIRDNT